MDPLTSKQMKIADVLIDWARDHASEPTTNLLIDEGKLSQLIGDDVWKRSTADDLLALIAFCNRESYPLIPLMVVIPGLNKPEKTFMTHAFKATLSPAENAKRWQAALDEISATNDDVWNTFKARVQPADE